MILKMVNFGLKLIPRLEEAIRNPVVETPAIQSNQTSKKKYP